MYKNSGFRLKSRSEPKSPSRGNRFEYSPENLNKNASLSIVTVPISRPLFCQGIEDLDETVLGEVGRANERLQVRG